LDAAIPAMGQRLRDALLPHHDADQLGHGQPLLQVHMAEHALRRFLRNEVEALRNGLAITPLALEADMGQPLPGAARHLGSPVRSIGRLDRVDEANGMRRILDLKSGSVRPEDLVVRELALEELAGGKRYALQLMVYAWLYLTGNPEVEAVQAGILPLQHAASSEPLFLALEGRACVGRGDLPAIGELLDGIVLRMMDPGLRLAHDPDSHYCAFCFTGE